MQFGHNDQKANWPQYIVDDYQTFDPAHPDSPEAFKLPVSPGRSNVAPRGQ